VGNCRDKDMPQYDLNIDTIRYIVPSLQVSYRYGYTRGRVGSESNIYMNINIPYTVLAACRRRVCLKTTHQPHITSLWP